MSWERQRGALGCGYRDFSGASAMDFVREYCARMDNGDFEMDFVCTLDWNIFPKRGRF